MTPESPEFKAIDQLTTQSDYRGLCECALRSLDALAPGLKAELYEAYDTRGHLAWETTELEDLVVRRFPEPAESVRPPWLEAGFAALQASPDAGIFDWPQTDAKTYICVTGSTAGISRFIAVTPERGSPELRNSIMCIVRIFSNQIALLDRFERDALTDLLSRQSFDYRFEEIIEYHRQNTKRQKKSTLPWLAIADIDHFKRVNDTFGHLFGDEILLLFSQLMRKTFRFDDLLFRYGGEEFVVILHNTDSAGAAHALKRFHESVGDYDFPTIGRLTASIGWVGIRPDDIATQNIHRADKALYHAKGAGRNHIVNYEQTFGDSNDDIPETLIDIN